MTWEETLEAYEHESRKAVEAHYRLGMLELDKADYVVEGAKILQGGENPKTGKPHSWTSALAEVKEHPDYREIKERILAAERDAGEAEVRARSLWLQLKHGISAMEVRP